MKQKETTTFQLVEQDGTIVGDNEACDNIVEVEIESAPPRTPIQEKTVSKWKELFSHYIDIKAWKDYVYTMIRKTRSSYGKRNVITNIILSAYMFIPIIMTLSVFLFAGISFFGKMSIFGMFIFLPFMFAHLLCVVYAYQFVVLNRKESVRRSLLMTAVTVIPYCGIFVLMYEFVHDSAYLTFIGLTLCIYAITMGPLLLVALRLQKYGASAWVLMDVPRSQKRKRFEFSVLWNVLVFCIVYSVILCILGCTTYFLKNAFSTFKDVGTAEIGDYYYEDGTVSSELRSEKKCVGVIYSLKTTDYEAEMGFRHGHIISLTDCSKDKQVWDYYDISRGDDLFGTNLESLPDYTWKNRTLALEDKEGLQYAYNCNVLIESLCQDLKYPENISRWYVPTAGEWTDILKNLGGVKVDTMLRFDASVATKKLEKYNINPKRWYWTITEQDGDNVWSIRIADGQFGSRTPKSNQAYIRPIAAF